MSLKSWLTSSIPPSKSFIASARASIVSISKWFVGSSNSSICGFCHASQANVTRHLCPSERFLIGQVCKNNSKHVWHLMYSNVQPIFKIELLSTISLKNRLTLLPAKLSNLNLTHLVFCLATMTHNFKRMKSSDIWLISDKTFANLNV